MQTSGGKFRFGVYEVNLASGELRKQGTLLRLQEQPFQILVALLEKPGEVVTRDELIRRLWHDGTVVDFDRGLNAAVTRLRQVLSDTAESPRFVETVARRGYRFIAPIEGLNTLQPPPASPGIAVEEAPVPPSNTNLRPKLWLALVVISLIAGPAAWLALHKEPIAKTPPVVALPLTSEPGTEGGVSFSPDGTQIVYSWDQENRVSHVFVRQVGLGDPVRLTSSDAEEYSPVWSRDGRHIAFLRTLNENQLALIVSTVLGGMEREITKLYAGLAKGSPSVRHQIDWAANGKHLIVAASEERAGLEGLLDVNIETGEKHWLAKPPKAFSEGVSNDPAVSPDGRTLAFVKSTSVYKREIFLMPLSNGVPDQSKAHQLTSEALALHPTWTRDGKEIVFVSSDALWRIQAKPGSKPALILTQQDRILYPAISSGNRLAFTKTFADVNVWRQQVNAGNDHPPPAPLISFTSFEQSAEYSPDGSKIALQSTRSGKNEIWVCDGDGTRCTQITTTKGFAGSPQWSPDGNQIAFDSDAEGHFDVYTIAATGGPPRRLTSHVSDNAAPTWSRDGNWIYFLSTRSGRNEIWKLPSKGGPEIQVTRNGGMMALESPDGKYLYYSNGDGKGKLSRSLTDGTGETLVLEAVNGRAFAVTKDRIIYLNLEENGTSSLRSFDIATGKDSRIAVLRKHLFNGISLSPDGRYAIYSQVDNQGADLMMIENFR